MNQTEHVLLLNMVVTHSGLKTWNVTLFGPFTKKKITFNISQLGCRDSSVWVSPYDHVKISYVLFSSVHSPSVVSDSLWAHGLQHARLPCPSPTPGVCSNSCPLSQWCHLTTSSSVLPFSSCLQSFPTSGFFQMSQLFTSGGQNIEVSASASVLPINILDWFLLGWTGWTSLQSKKLSRVFSKNRVQSLCSSALNFLYSQTLTAINNYGKPITFVRQT